LYSIYNNRIGRPTTDDEVRGYWVFLLGLVLGTLGLVLFLPSESAVGTSGVTIREVSIILVALGLAALVAGPVIRLPLQGWANYAAYVGQAVCIAAVLWFSVEFPSGWSVQTGSQPVIILYAVGLGIITIGGAIVPLIAGVSRDEYEESERRGGELQQKLDAVSDERDQLQSKVEQLQSDSDAGEGREAELQQRIEELENERVRLESQLESARGDSAAGEDQVAELEAELQEEREEKERLKGEVRRMQSDHEDAEQEREDLQASTAALESQIESLQASQGQFELYEDNGGNYRWRLRHRNGNVIAASGQGYTRKHNAQKGLASVRRNALGATIMHVEPEGDEEPEEALEATPLVPAVEDESRAEFEVYEDNGGKFRWRLVHDNGNIIADSAQGYASKQKARQGMNSVKSNADPASYLQFEPTSFEIYRDNAGEWRWRFVHKNGNILAAASEGYTRRRDAKRSVDGIRNDLDSAEFEVYQDNRGDYRWRLRAGNQEIVATSGEGYNDEGEANDAVERVSKYAPEADALDVGLAAFEVFKDAAEEWRWRLRHRNGNIIADSSEGYSSRTAAQAGIESVKKNAPGAEESA
jgi:uncharacterized protein YegP (UPF0339 family)